MPHRFRRILAIPFTVALLPLAASAVDIPAGTAFSFQGQYTRDGEPLNETCQVTFRLYDAELGGVQIGTDLVQQATFEAGLLSVSLDFGAQAFGGYARWLELELLCVGDGSATVLAPRQRIQPVPGSLYSASTDALQGQPLDVAGAQVGDVLFWDGTQWIAAPDLQDLVAQLQQFGNGPFILGPTSWNGDGSWEYGGLDGVSAANLACQDEFPNEPFAHLCTLAEMEEAVFRANYPASPTFDDVWTWTASAARSFTNTGVFDTSLGNTCEGLKSFSGEGFTGTRVKVDFDFVSATNGTTSDASPVLVVEVDTPCPTVYPVMCCR